MAAGLATLGHNEVAAHRLRGERLLHGADLPSSQRAATMDRSDQIGARLAVEELDHPYPASGLGHLLDARPERHQKADAESAGRGLGARWLGPTGHHAQPALSRNRDRQLGGADTAQRCQLQRQLTSDQFCEASTHA